MANPIVKVGDQVLIIKVNNSQPKSYEGRLVTVHQLQGSNNFNILTETGGVLEFYSTSPADIWIAATKEAKIKYFEEELINNCAIRDELLDRIRFFESQLDILKNYESEDEYLLEKLDLVLNSPGPDKKEARIEALKLIRASKL